MMVRVTGVWIRKN